MFEEVTISDDEALGAHDASSGGVSVVSVIKEEILSNNLTCGELQYELLSILSVFILVQIR